MNIRELLIVTILLLSPLQAYTQKTVTLKQCYEQAIRKTPVAGEKDAYDNIWRLKDKNISRGWYPTLDAGGNYLYNSDIVDFSDAFSSVPIPGLADALPQMPHDGYRITIDINQVIYDGGAIKKARSIEEADLKVNQQQVESDLYKLRNSVTGIYFSILLVERQKEMLTSYAQLIDKRLNSMKSGVGNGVLLRSDIDVMMSEKIKIEQQITEIDLKKASLIAVLSDLTGEALGTDSKLLLPGISDDITGEIARPELKVYDLRIEQLEAGKGLLNTKRLPKAFGFATLGYGAPPGNNLFENELSSYYIVGAGIKWNIYDWGKVKNEKQQLAIQQGVLRGRKADLNDNIKRSLQTKEAEIASLAESLKRDTELINLRKRITASAESRYENGIITATELLGEMNAEKQAEISYEMHKISLEMAKIEYMNIIGRELD